MLYRCTCRICGVMMRISLNRWYLSLVNSPFLLETCFKFPVVLYKSYFFKGWDLFVSFFYPLVFISWILLAFYYLNWSSSSNFVSHLKNSYVWVFLSKTFLLNPLSQPEMTSRPNLVQKYNFEDHFLRHSYHQGWQPFHWWQLVSFSGQG